MFEDINKTMNLGGYSTTMWNLASTGLQIGSQLFNFFNQGAATDKYNNQMGANYRTQMGALQTQQVQQQKAAGAQQSRLAQASMIARSQVTTAMGESGLSGPTADRIQTEQQFAKSDASQQIDTNLNNQMAQGYRQGESMRSQAQASMKSEPSLLGLGLQIGGSLLGGLNPDEVRKIRPTNNKDSYASII